MGCIFGDKFRCFVGKEYVISPDNLSFETGAPFDAALRAEALAEELGLCVFRFLMKGISVSVDSISRPFSDLATIDTCWKEPLQEPFVAFELSLSPYILRLSYDTLFAKPRETSQSRPLKGQARRRRRAAKKKGREPAPPTPTGTRYSLRCLEARRLVSLVSPIWTIDGVCGYLCHGLHLIDLLRR